MQAGRQTSRWIRSHSKPLSHSGQGLEGFQHVLLDVPCTVGVHWKPLQSLHIQRLAPNKDTPTIEDRERERPLLRDLTLLQTMDIRPDSVSRLFEFLYVQRPYLSLTLPFSLVWIRPLL